LRGLVDVHKEGSFARSVTAETTILPLAEGERSRFGARPGRRQGSDGGRGPHGVERRVSSRRRTRSGRADWLDPQRPRKRNLSLVE